MDKVSQLPNGTKSVLCSHLPPIELKRFDTETEFVAKVQTHDELVFLEEIPNEVGYHGTCPYCGTKYFANPLEEGST